MRRLLWWLFNILSLKLGIAQIICPPEANDAIQRCVLPVKEYAEKMGLNVRDPSHGGHLDTLLPPAQAVEMFQELCDTISRFEFCVKEPRNQCPRHIVLNLIDVSYGYLCNEGFDPFMENANCLMQLDQDDNIRSCHRSTMKSIVNVNQDNNTNMDQKQARTCRSLNYFATCIENHVRNKCGVTAWGVIVRVLKDTTTALMANCAFTVKVPDAARSRVETAKSSNRVTAGGQKWSGEPGENHVHNEAPNESAAKKLKSGQRANDAQRTVKHSSQLVVATFWLTVAVWRLRNV